MSYHLKTKGNRPFYLRESNVRFFFILLFLLIIVFFGGIFSNWLSPVFHKIFDPIFSVSRSAESKFSYSLNFLLPKSLLIKENEELKSRVLDDETKLLSLEILKTENQILRGLKTSSTSPSVIASVIRLPDKMPYDDVLIDKGSEDGVVANARVFNSSDLPIGTIDHVYPNSSIIKLYSSPGETYDVFIGTGKVVGTAEGLGGGNFEVELPHGSPVVEGDPVTIPSISNKLFGVVESTDLVKNGTFIRVLFKNPFSFDELRFVRVDKK